jgi:hypothetical protein
MGRWAQNRRRGGSPPTASTSTGISILSAVVQSDPTILLITFSAAVSLDLGPAPDDNFQVAGVGPNAVSVGGSAAEVLVAFADAIFIGTTAELLAQPNWLVTSVDIPESTPITGAIFTYQATSNFSADPFKVGIQFSGPVTLGSFVDDGSITFPTVGNPIAAVQSAPDTIVLTLDTACGSGQLVASNSQPSWISQPLAFPWAIFTA